MEIYRQLHKEGFNVDVYSAHKTMQRRIREAQLLGVNYVLVVGDVEERNNTVSVRAREQNQAQNLRGQVLDGETELVHLFQSLRQQIQEFK